MRRRISANSLIEIDKYNLTTNRLKEPYSRSVVIAANIPRRRDLVRRVMRGLRYPPLFLGIGHVLAVISTDDRGLEVVFEFLKIFFFGNATPNRGQFIGR